VWGREKFEKYLRGLKGEQIKLSRKQRCRRGSRRRHARRGPTDNDDINNAKAEGLAVEAVLPGSGRGGMGTLLIPGRWRWSKDARTPKREKADRFHLRSAVEKELIAGRYLAYSVRDTSGVKAMDVDYLAVAHEIEERGRDGAEDPPGAVAHCFSMWQGARP